MKIEKLTLREFGQIATILGILLMAALWVVLASPSPTREKSRDDGTAPTSFIRRQIDLDMGEEFET